MIILFTCSVQYGTLKRNPEQPSMAAKSLRRPNDPAKTQQPTCSSIKELVGTNYGLKNKGMICAPWDNITTLKAAVIHGS